EMICVYGDYDADGVTATALLYSYLEMQGANVTYLLPSRTGDGYGLSSAVVDRIKEMGTKLIVTVDNGISAIDEAKYIKSLGIELVVTDHHLPGDELPDCIAVVDPHRADSECPFKDYAGVGVAYKLCCAIEGDDRAVCEDFIDLVAIGTVADIVPLKGENRTFVKQGLRSMNAFMRPGVEALVNVAGLSDKQLVASNISFGLAPRINAAGRMDTAEKALDLLLSEDPDFALEIATELNDANAKRHEEENKILADCNKLIYEDADRAHMPVIVMNGDGWHEGVLGIVASKLLDQFQRPVIVLSNREDGFSRGSARSIEGFSMFDALTACSEHLVMYGGHAQAAGLTLKTEDIPKFMKAMTEYAYQQPLFYPSLSVDCKLNTETISLDLVNSIKLLEPFGADNPAPLFGIYDLVVDGITELGDKKQHLRIYAHKDGKNNQITLMNFNVPHGVFPHKNGDKFDAIVTLDKSVWNGQDRLSIVIKNTRPAGVDDDTMVKCVKLYDKIELRSALTTEEAKFATPERPLFARLYTYLKKNQGLSMNSFEYMANKVCENGDNLCKARVALLALVELGIVTYDANGDLYVPETDNKFDLNDAPVMQYLSEVK
ncbi:MAG: single-stranded-DNA-specific exonuclease RecJ, partial [Clostridia bacterium]|nr:single-stranded-DNA-specific exonuclease RecJ [Clostridia bacterium]